MTVLCRWLFSDSSFGSVSSAVTNDSIDASSKGYGSGASDNGEYADKKADDMDLDWFVRRSMNPWYDLSKPFMSASFPASSSFRKSLVF